MVIKGKEVKGKEIKATFMKLRGEGKTYKQIGEMCGLTRQRVEEICKRDYKEKFTDYKCIYPIIKKWIKKNKLEIWQVQKKFRVEKSMRNKLAGTCKFRENEKKEIERIFNDPIEKILIKEGKDE